MKQLFFGSIVLVIAVGLMAVVVNSRIPYGAPPYAEDDSPLPPGLDRFPDILNWKRPAGPPKVALQVGHWKNSELPDELGRIRESGGGTSRGKTPEWEVMLVIALETKKLLETEGIHVDILPATIPQAYWADAFIALHADGSTDTSVSGYKVAPPRRDFTGDAGTLATLIETAYEKETGLSKDPNITRNMRGYYAFSWWRYDHAIHPKTPGVILETGFLTNTHDANLLIRNPAIPSRAISEALKTFLAAKKLV